MPPEITKLTPSTAIRIALHEATLHCAKPFEFTAVPGHEPDTLIVRVEDPRTGAKLESTLSYRRSVVIFENTVRSIVSTMMGKLRAKSGKLRDEAAEKAWSRTDA